MHMSPCRTVLACLLLAAGTACGGKVFIDAPPTSSTGGAGGGGAGGAPTCAAIPGLCQAWCDKCASVEPGPCHATCLAEYEGFYPDCADAQAALLACRVAHATGPADCNGALDACSGELDAIHACINSSFGCNGFGCEGCSCETSCSTAFGSNYADGVYTCTVDGNVVGTCAETCTSAAPAACCWALFFPDCPL